MSALTPEKRERPILFSGPMVRAILAGAKTVTRRVLAVQPETAEGGRWSLCVASTDRRDRGMWSYRAPDPDGRVFTDRGRERDIAQVRCPYGGPLWVRETWYDDAPGSNDIESVDYRATHNCAAWEAGCACRGDGGDGSHGSLWRTPIYMPRWASRITLDVVSVRVERLHEIDEADAIREGVDAVSVADVPRNGTLSRRDDFAQLWEEINGKRAPWATNPWVFRVEFARVKP